LGAALGLAEPAVDDRARARDVPSPNLKVKWRQKQVKRRQKKVKWIWKLLNWTASTDPVIHADLSAHLEAVCPVDHHASVALSAAVPRLILYNDFALQLRPPEKPSASSGHV
jgi:hypothetical protein